MPVQIRAGAEDEVLGCIKVGTSLVAQWLGFHASTEGGPSLIPGRGTKIPHAEWCSQKKKRKYKENLKIPECWEGDKGHSSCHEGRLTPVLQSEGASWRRVHWSLRVSIFAALVRCK